MKICLVNPPISCLTKDIPPICPPVGLVYLGSSLERAGYQVIILDSVLEGGEAKDSARIESGRKVTRFGHSANDLAERVASQQPDVIGISNNMSVNEDEALEAATEIKRRLPMVPVIFGGVSATARSEEILKHPAVDFVIAGEADQLLPLLMERLYSRSRVDDLPAVGYRQNGRVVPPRARAIVDNLDELPDPNWDLVPMTGYLNHPFPFVNIAARNAVMITSRGCVSNCVFCSGSKLLGKWRPRSLGRVRNEIRRLKQKYGIQSVHFLDANINVDPDRFVELCHIMREERLTWSPIGGLFIRSLDCDIVTEMINAGCFHLTLAIEHGQKEMQRYIGKIVPLEKIRAITCVASRFGVWTHGSFIIGFPSETRETAMQCLDYAKKSGLDSISVFTAVPLPGSRLYDELSKKTDLKTTDMRFLAERSYSGSLGLAELSELRDRIFSSFVVHKTINTILHPIDFVRKLMTNKFLYSRILWQSLRRYLKLRFR